MQKYPVSGERKKSELGEKEKENGERLMALRLGALHSMGNGRGLTRVFRPLRVRGAVWQMAASWCRGPQHGC